MWMTRVCTDVSTDWCQPAWSQDIAVHRRRLELNPEKHAAAEWNEYGVCLVHPTSLMPPHSRLGRANLQPPNSSCSYASKMTYIVSRGALNSTHSLTVRDLGVYADGAMIMRTCINHVLSSCFSVLWRFNSPSGLRPHRQWLLWSPNWYSVIRCLVAWNLLSTLVKFILLTLSCENSKQFLLLRLFSFYFQFHFVTPLVFVLTLA